MPIYEKKDNEEKLVGYRIKKGVLGITKDIEVYLGAKPDKEAVFQSRRAMNPWNDSVQYR